MKKEQTTEIEIRTLHFKIVPFSILNIIRIF